MRQIYRRLLFVASVGLLVGAAGAVSAADFTAFESGAVRPLALSANGDRLFALNIPDAQLEIFAIANDGSLTHAAAVQVGLEPVALAVRSATEVWVVNHLSDSISIVDVGSTPPRVTRTLLVGDEPQDILFAGPSAQRAFITTAHRGQNNPNDPQLSTPGIGRADVWVFDATNPGAGLGGTPIAILSLFGDTPRALAKSPDGTTVYVAVFKSGNRTTTINDGLVCDGGADADPCTILGNDMPGGLPAPNENFQHVAQPEVGLIVKFNAATSQWEDELGRSWNDGVRFSLPDYDVFALDAVATPPVQVAAHAGVGTVLFNMVTNPTSGKLYVSNTEARNEVRFEGPGTFGGSTVRGHLHEARISVIDGTNVSARHLNKHIDYDVFPSPRIVRNRSLATPLDMQVSSDGSTLYVAAFGSSKVGIFKTAELEADSFVPSSSKQIVVPGGGPCGLALLEAKNRLYVLTRFDNGIAVLDPQRRKEMQHVALHNPEPFGIVDGRRFLYDAAYTSSNGEASCSSCHVFGDLDDLAWDLGNPDDIVLNNPNPFRIGPLGDPAFHPLKGPMTTQTLRGLANHGPMHWRGDRTGGNDVAGDALDESQAFNKFNVAFGGLLGRSTSLTASEMQRFTDFMLQVLPPPNPIRPLDNVLTTAQQAGRDFFLNETVDANVLQCKSCHALAPASGFFGTDGMSSFENETQHFKIPQLRNAYTKVGMFGFAGTLAVPGGDHTFMGDQIRGFGYLHDGSVDSVFRFLTATVFTFPNEDIDRHNVESFVFAFDTNLAPVVGQQITLTDTNAAQAGARVDLLVERAAAGDCDLVVKGSIAGEPRGWYRTAAGDFQPDRAAESALSEFDLRALAATSGQELTFSCVAPGSGVRAGVDRDSDSIFDADERDAGTDPGSEISVPSAAIACNSTAIIEKAKLRVTHDEAPAGDETITLRGEWTVGSLSLPIDPIANGMRFRINDVAGNPIYNRVVPRGRPIAAGYAGWTLDRRGTTWTYRDRKGAAGGVTRVTVQDKGASIPGRYAFTVMGKLSDFRIEPSQLPAQMIVVLGGLAQAGADQCAGVQFSDTSGIPPSCIISASASTVNCR